MAGRSLLGSTKEYLGFLVRTIVFPFIWVWAVAVARENRRDDPNGAKKVAVGIAVGVVLAGGVGFLLYDFEQDSRAGMYDQLDGRMRTAVGEAAYQDQVTVSGSKQNQIDIIRANLQAAEDARDETNATSLRENLTLVQAELAEAQANVAALQDNHRFYLRLAPAIEGQDDARVKQMVASFSFEQVVDAAVWDASKVDGRTERAYAIKDRADADMMQVMTYLLYPGVIGVLFGPMFIALGSVMARAWEPSESVGFKKYPGAALGLFLILGAFGWPSLLFASWGFYDIAVRHREGQISL